jgi:hypothetical protein
MLGQLGNYAGPVARYRLLRKFSPRTRSFTQRKANSFAPPSAMLLNVTAIRKRELEEQAKSTFGRASSQAQRRIASLGASIGPPWTKGHKTAALAAFIILARTLGRGSKSPRQVVGTKLLRKTTWQGRLGEKAFLFRLITRWRTRLLSVPLSADALGRCLRSWRQNQGASSRNKLENCAVIVSSSQLSGSIQISLGAKRQRRDGTLTFAASIRKGMQHFLRPTAARRYQLVSNS